MLYKNRFGYLLISIVIFLLLVAFNYQSEYIDTIIDLCIVLITFSGIYSFYQRKRQVIAGIILGVLHFNLFLTEVNIFGFDLEMDNSIKTLIVLFFFIWLQYNVIKEIAAHKDISLNSIIGAINGFFILGILAGYSFLLIHLHYEDAFHIPAKLDHGFYSFIYFGFVTITTLGYGDITPVIPPSESIVILFSVIGQLYLAIIIANFISQYKPTNPTENKQE